MALPLEPATTRAAHQTARPVDPQAPDSAPERQPTLTSEANLPQSRELSAPTSSKPARAPGTAIPASVLSSRATRLHLQCRPRRHVKTIHPGPSPGASGQDLPRQRESIPPDGQKKDRRLDPYQTIHDKPAPAHTQATKTQEAPDMVPVGDLLRHMLLSAERALPGRLVPGSREALHRVCSGGAKLVA
ncbi:hypothetical protein CALCODRAFT_559280 [Calocera cornea HHB12733]|uniref:MCM OB domain-containing protein n=1 Tax=Calocera cornea HHB12733 TaxID=1353952 RepID=A0A165AMY1_9BASI|nr:hypothetical protein CALCODRAFT_559280 [Calocera cornea HHB12733]